MWDTGLDLFFPRFCIGCGFVGEYLCPSCEGGMKHITKTTCLYCGRPSLLGLTHPSCKKDEGIDGHLSIYAYEGLFQTILVESKYKGAYKTLLSLLAYPHEAAWHLLQIWNTLFSPIALPVPLHPQRMKERGFNQSELIQSAYCGSLPSKTLLRRVRNTVHLANIQNGAGRRSHIRNAFEYVGDTVPHAALLIDDVTTSHSTLSECARTLKRAGVRTVLAFSLAKG